MRIFDLKRLNKKHYITFFVLFFLVLLIPFKTSAITITSSPADFINLWTGGLNWIFVDAAGEAGDYLAGKTISAVTALLFWIFGIFLNLTGVLLNFSINITIHQMSDFIRMDGVRDTWKIFRDLVNIGFIFGIVYIAISTILNANTSNIKTLLGKIIMAAILVNFTFFYTGFLIDISNVTTLSVYKEILRSHTDLETAVPSTSVPVSPETPPDLSNIEIGMSGIFMKNLSFSKLIWQPDTEAQYASASAVAVLVFGSIFIFLLAFSFLMAAALLISRVVILVLLVITSPISVLGGIFPQISAQANDWWKTLWYQLIFAPAYMFMTLIVVKVIESPDFSRALGQQPDGPGLRTAIESGFSGGTISVVFGFLIIIGLVMASVIVAKKFATQGSSLATGIAGKAAGYVGQFQGWSQKKALAPVRAAGGFVREQTTRRAGSSLRRLGGRIGEDAQLEKPEKISGKLLRKLPLGTKLGAVMGAAGRSVDNSGYEKKYKGYSDNALKNAAASRTITPNERYYLMRKLTESGELKPLGKFDGDLIKTTQKDLEEIGDKKTAKAIKRLLHQYAKEGSKKAVPGLDGKPIEDEDENGNRFIVEEYERAMAVDGIRPSDIEKLNKDFVRSTEEIRESVEKLGLNAEKTEEKRIEMEEEQTAIMKAMLRNFSSSHLTEMNKREDNMLAKFLERMKDMHTKFNEGRSDPVDISTWLKGMTDKQNKLYQDNGIAKNDISRLAGIFNTKKASAELAQIMDAAGIPLDAKKGGVASRGSGKEKETDKEEGKPLLYDAYGKKV